MADKQSGGKQKSVVNLSETKAKVVTFANQLNRITSIEMMKGYLNFLCPTIQEKVAFVAMFGKTYPQDKEVRDLLEKWLDEEFAKCASQTASGIEKLSEVYKSAYGADAEDKKRETADVEAQKQQKKEGLLKRLLKSVLGIGKSSHVSPLSNEELVQAREFAGRKQNEAKSEIDAELKLKAYNEKVAKRAEMTRLSPAYEKGASVMSR